MCCSPYDKEEPDGECPDCGAPTCGGVAVGGCTYSPVVCDTCEDKPCDGSC